MSLDGQAIPVGVNKGTTGMSVELFSICLADEFFRRKQIMDIKIILTKEELYVLIIQRRILKNAKIQIKIY